MGKNSTRTTGKSSKKKSAVKWRPALKREMKKVAEIEAVDQASGRPVRFRYRWEHVKTVVKLAKKLARQTGADVEIVEAAAWLHDIKKFDARGRHPQEGAKFARTFLKGTDFPKQKIGRVAEAIELHMGLWLDEPLDNLEAAVLWDADKLSKIGLTAAFHWLGGAFNRSKTSLTTRDIITFGRRADEWQHKTVASMNTEPARRAAIARLQTYQELWDRLEAELSGRDLPK